MTAKCNNNNQPIESTSQTSSPSFSPASSFSSHPDTPVLSEPCSRPRHRLHPAFGMQAICSRLDSLELHVRTLIHVGGKRNIGASGSHRPLITPMFYILRHTQLWRSACVFFPVHHRSQVKYAPTYTHVCFPCALCPCQTFLVIVCCPFFFPCHNPSHLYPLLLLAD